MQNFVNHVKNIGLYKESLWQNYSLIKPWPFRGWVMDLIKKINLISSSMHGYVIVENDYFTK